MHNLHFINFIKFNLQKFIKKTFYEVIINAYANEVSARNDLHDYLQYTL
jgi:hypothetical protein